MSKRLFYTILCIASLLAGASIYAIFRENSYIGAFASNLFPIEPIKEFLKTHTNSFFKFYLADFLWCFSLCLGLFAILVQKYKYATFCVCTAFAFGTAWEVLQYVGLIRGTGDIFDVITYFLAALTAMILFIIKEKKDEKN